MTATRPCMYACGNSARPGPVPTCGPCAERIIAAYMAVPQPLADAQRAAMIRVNGADLAESILDGGVVNVPAILAEVDRDLRDAAPTYRPVLAAFVAGFVRRLLGGPEVVKAA